MKFRSLLLLLCTALTLPVFAVDSSTGLLLVANQGDHTLSILDPDAGRLIAKVPSNEIRGHEVVASPDGKLAYLPIYGDSGVGQRGTNGRTIEVIDIDKHQIVSTIDLGRPVRPHCIRVGSDGLLYVTAELDKSVDIVDPRSGQRIGSVPTGRPESHMFVFSKDGTHAYTSNVGTGTVSLIDLKSRKLVTVISVADIAQRISISNDGNYVFTSDQREPRLAIIDTRQNHVKHWVKLPTMGYGTAPTNDGQSLLVTLPEDGRIALIDLSTFQIERTLEVGAHPVEILMRPDQPIAYVSCSQDGKVAVVNLKEWRVETMLDSGPGADGLAWAAR